MQEEQQELKGQIILDNIKEMTYISDDLDYSLDCNVLLKNKLMINLSIYNGLKGLDENFMLNFAIKAPYILFNEEELSKVEKYGNKMVVEMNYPNNDNDEYSDEYSEEDENKIVVCLINENTFQYLNAEEYQLIKNNNKNNNNNNKKIVINFNVPME